jgi:hypothetical protein
MFLPPYVPVNVFGVYGLLDRGGRRRFWVSLVVAEAVLMLALSWVGGR